MGRVRLGWGASGMPLEQYACLLVLFGLTFIDISKDYREPGARIRSGSGLLNPAGQH